jgi:Flp pilus assembly protein TadD
MAFRAALRISPHSPRAWYDLAVSLELEGLKEEARAAYAQLDRLTLVTAA